MHLSVNSRTNTNSHHNLPQALRQLEIVNAGPYAITTPFPPDDVGKWATALTDLQLLRTGVRNVSPSVSQLVRSREVAAVQAP